MVQCHLDLVPLWIFMPMFEEPTWFDCKLIWWLSKPVCNAGVPLLLSWNPMSWSKLWKSCWGELQALLKDTWVLAVINTYWRKLMSRTISAGILVREGICSDWRNSQLSPKCRPAVTMFHVHRCLQCRDQASFAGGSECLLVGKWQSIVYWMLLSCN